MVVWGWCGNVVCTVGRRPVICTLEHPTQALKWYQCSNDLTSITDSFGSLGAVQKLGMAVAWPAVQVQLLVSTVWGAVWYREIRSTRAGAALLGASASVVAGVVCLARAKGL